MRATRCAVMTGFGIALCTAELPDVVYEAESLLQPANRLGTKQAAGSGQGGALLDTHNDKVHCVFTVDCRPFNLWQAEVLFASALAVNHPGSITEIVTGCSEERMVELQQRHDALDYPQRFKLHFTPDFTQDGIKYVNKPFGIQHWFQHAGPDDDVVAVLDPDFIFMQPLTPEIRKVSSEVLWEGPVPERVEPGVVAAGRYDLDASSPTGTSEFVLRAFKPENLTNDAFMRFLCNGTSDGESGCAGLTDGEVVKYHHAGVPYIAHKDDWSWLAEDWASITQRIVPYTPEGNIYLEMWSWSLANAHHGQRQFLLYEFSGTGKIKAWTDEDALDAERCSQPLPTRWEPPKPSETSLSFVHFCQPREYFTKYWLDASPNELNGKHLFERCDPEDVADPFYQHPFPNTSVPKFEERGGGYQDRVWQCMMRTLVVQQMDRSCKQKF